MNARRMFWMDESAHRVWARGERGMSESSHRD